MNKCKLGDVPSSPTPGLIPPGFRAFRITTRGVRLRTEVRAVLSWLFRSEKAIFHATSEVRKLTLVDLLMLSRRASRDDRCEVLDLQARSAHQRPVDVRLSEQFDGVVGLDAATVLDADLLGHAWREHLA